eukprot:CAMPEP_0194493780 /NCGR_PEP_ID=MMETSP0253-20130528/11896_1 /TAXON_ID=2966 /ORGANISM="Noctiluca scintillans" /LENGTH=152 /DNA_ID=CAMNT_0039334805 /DNA_START=103 /DNA_END=561 /DNA_ORIENTATION=-
MKGLWRWLACECLIEESAMVEYTDAAPHRGHLVSTVQLSDGDLQSPKLTRVRKGQFADRPEAILKRAGFVVLTFELPSGDVRSVEFTERPLGLKFAESTFGPFVISTTRQVADTTIEPGWRLTHIDSESIRHLEREDLWHLLAKRTRTLKLV